MKKQLSLQEKFKILDGICDKVNAKNGSVIMGRIEGNKEIEEALSISYIPTPSAALNAAIGGGFPRRRCTLLSGAPDSGKTSLALETIANEMKQNPNAIALWIESENSLEKNYIVDTFGIDPERFLFIDFDSEMGAEKVLDIVQSVAMSGSIDIICINSLKCLIPSKEFEASLEDSLVAVQARFNSRLTRKFTGLVAKNNIAFILITHLSTDIGSMSRDFLAA